MMGYVFQKISSNMDTLTIGSLGKFVNTISTNGMYAILSALNPLEPLALAAYKHLILNFDIWITTPFSLQQELANFIMKAIQKQNLVFIFEIV